MTGRVFLTLVLGILAASMLAWWISAREGQSAIGAYRDYHAVERAEQMITTADIVPPASRWRFRMVANRTSVQLEPYNAALPTSQEQTAFMRALAARLGPSYQLAHVLEQPARCSGTQAQPWFAPIAPKQRFGFCESVNVRLRDGEILRLQVLPPRNVPNGFESDNVSLIVALFGVTIALLAYAVARMSTRPLKQLAQAAKDLGHDINRPPLTLAGATEIRQASAAFNAMQARLRQYIFQRTQMLAAITHDLQTPLTRMRLRLEKVADADLQEKLKGDLSAMQEMVREGLELARSMDTNEELQALDLDSLLDSVCTDAADSGQQVQLHGRANMALMGRPMALRRCFGNLIDNAVKYGQRADVSVERGGGSACVRVRDRGPGIPPSELASVFEPFYRVEGSRSRESGGTGLGLTIARNIAEQHGGSIALANLPDGGLEATVVLPESYAGN
jgi:signal transduction histidine kinase